MSLYPSLEDMKVGQMAQAQQVYTAPVAAAAVEAPPAYGAAAPPVYSSAPEVTYPSQQLATLGIYPSLDDYMGITLNPAEIEQQMALVARASQEVAVPASEYAGQMQIAPITGDNKGVRRSEIRQGVREVILCKDQDGKMGLRVRSVNKGIFVAFVHVNSPAALAGLRFGDQILQIDGDNVAGWDTDKCMSILKKCKQDKINMAIRDRPFERTITMQKDSTGHIGFVFKNGKITAIVKDSSAARNGVLIEHQLVEVNGQNVVGMKDKDTGKLIDDGGSTVTITILPTFIYDQIMKSIGSSLVKKFMDHSMPDL